MKINENSFWFFLINKRPIAIIITLAIVLIGSFSALTLPRELQPEINVPYASVSTVLPGGNPLDVENLITDPLEKEIATISDIKTLSSQSSFGVSVIFIEFETSADINQSILDLKDAVDRAKNSLPDDATDPYVNKTEANSNSIISFSITGKRPLNEITDIAETMQEELKKIQGVSKVEIFGSEKNAIYIRVDKELSEEYGIDLNQISNAIKGANVNFPIGVIQTDNLNYSVRLDNQIRSLDELENLPLMKIQDTTIFIKDIAKIEKSFPEKNSLSKFSENGKDANESISLVVYKKSGGNIIKIAESSQSTLDTMKEKGKIPQDIQIAVSNDNSKFISKDLGVLINNGLATAIIIILILFLALGFREGLLAGLSIPLSFFITLSVMYLMDLSINSLSLFSLVIALGIMVDTAIVIMDGIHKNIEEGLTTIDACRESVNMYKWALISGTFTTIFAFFPMLLVSGIIGEFLKTLPIVISSALLSSLFVSLTLIPSISSKYLNKKKKANLLRPLFQKLSKIAHSTVSKNLESRKRRVITILISIALFFGSMSIPLSGMLKMELFPKTDIQYFFIDIEAAKGTTIEETAKITKQIEEQLYSVPEITNFLSIIGQLSSSMTLGATGPSQDSNVSNITINLVDEEDRDRKSFEIAESLRQEFANFRSAKVTIQEISEGPPGDSAVTVKVRGDEFEKLNEITEDIKKQLKEIPGTQNVKDNRKVGLNEFVFSFDREKLSQHGLNAGLIALNIRNAVQGISSEEITIDNEDLAIFIRYNFDKNENEKTILSVSELNNLVIQSPYGYSLTLNEVGTYVLASSLSTINREDQKREIKITSDVTSSGNSVTITNTLKEKLKDYQLPENYEILFGGDLEQINDSFNQLYLSMIVGLILIAFSLVLEFNSYRQTIIVLLTLPLGVIGVFPGLKLIGLNFSFPAFLGLVALSGVVVNNAIVLLDSINKNREDGMDLKTAINETVLSRVRPIVLTTITTIVGILPLAISNAFWAGLGFTLSFGLAVSSITTLIVIPTIYFILESRKELKTK